MGVDQGLGWLLTRLVSVTPGWLDNLRPSQALSSYNALPELQV
jgi:hypothetical protein